jgi:hypothetical protein
MDEPRMAPKPSLKNIDKGEEYATDQGPCPFLISRAKILAKK